MSADLDEFQRGYLIATANIANLHNETVIAADVAAELGVTWAQIKAADFTDYDLLALKKIRGESVRPFDTPPSRRKRPIEGAEGDR